MTWRATSAPAPPELAAGWTLGKPDLVLDAPEPYELPADGKDVYLRDIWPSQQEIRQTVQKCVTAEQFRRRYADVFTGDQELSAAVQMQKCGAD